MKRKNKIKNIFMIFLLINAVFTSLLSINSVSDEIDDYLDINDIPDQFITEGNVFDSINLDEFIFDSNHTFDEIIWTYFGNQNLDISIVDRRVTIIIPNPDWNGEENLTFTATNIVTDTTTGTKIGTATSQKIGFWNKTPIIQPTTGVAEASFTENAGGTAVNVDSTFE